MYLITITTDGKNPCISLGKKEKVVQAVKKEMVLYPELRVVEHEYNTEKDMYQDLTHIREEYPDAEVLEF